MTAKAYEAVPTPGGGVQPVAARENSWPADDVPAPKNGDNADTRVLSRRVITRGDGDNGVGNSRSSADGFNPISPTQPAPPQAESNPVRRSVRLNGTSPAMPVGSSDNQNSRDGRFGSGISSPQGIAPRNPNLPVPPPETEGPLGLVSGKPMRFFQAPIFDTRTNSGASDNWFAAALLRDSRTSQPSSFDVNPPQLAFAPNRQNSLSSGNAATPVASGPGDAFAPPISSPDLQGALSFNDAYLEYLKRLNAKPAQASTFDTSTPAAPLAPSDDSNFSGGMLGRLMAVAGIDPRNPSQFAPPPQDDELRDFYGDNPLQPWTLQRQR